MPLQAIGIPTQTTYSLASFPPQDKKACKSTDGAAMHVQDEKACESTIRAPMHVQASDTGRSADLHGHFGYDQVQLTFGNTASTGAWTGIQHPQLQERLAASSTTGLQGLSHLVDTAAMQLGRFARRVALKRRALHKRALAMWRTLRSAVRAVDNDKKKAARKKDADREKDDDRKKDDDRDDQDKERWKLAVLKTLYERGLESSTRVAGQEVAAETGTQTQDWLLDAAACGDHLVPLTRPPIPLPMQAQQTMAHHISMAVARELSFQGEVPAGAEHHADDSDDLEACCHPVVVVGVFGPCCGFQVFGFPCKSPCLMSPFGAHRRLAVSG
ncbi:unnamed protein product [Symbiodinium necroappetens]|uniref:Uncharacterized protein n=1 Tax=Symbiodinium necroappetens TaxID=1628268 RepID=A0A812NGY9_9DINO|nr:unnamed protein product [Symbiodinium necroappetens]